MDKIAKALNKLSTKERKRVKEILSQINEGNFQTLNLKKLKDRNDIFRVRKGNIRIIFRKKDNGIRVLTIERRTTTTYRKF